MEPTNENAGMLRPLFGVGSLDKPELSLTDEVGTGFDVGAITSEEWKEKRLEQLAAEKARAEHRAQVATRRGTTIVVSLVALLIVGLVVTATLLAWSLPAAVPSVAAQAQDVTGEREFATAVRLLAGAGLLMAFTTYVRFFNRY